MEIKIDYKKLNEFKQMYQAIQRQLSCDYIAENGSYLAKEDLMSAAIVCLLIKSYSVSKSK